jgi:hypothetical protein
VKLPSAKLCLFILLSYNCIGKGVCRAQDLIPRAYVITPTHTNAVILTYSFNGGSILFDPDLPITNATGKLSVPSFSYYHTFSFFGRSANIAATLPYAVGNFQGIVNGSLRQIYRSGLMDSIFRFSVNLKGGPTMTATEDDPWGQPQNLRSNRPVRPDSAGYSEYESLGVEARTRFVQAVGELDH